MNSKGVSVQPHPHGRDADSVIQFRTQDGPPLPLPHHSNAPTWRAWLYCSYNWVVWGLLTLLLFSQVLTVFWDVGTFQQHVVFGETPRAGETHALIGSNDELYADRAIACVLSGHALRPIQLSQALVQQEVLPPTSALPTGVDGIRVVLRDFDSLLTVEPVTLADYEHKCETLTLVLEPLLDACEALGYNVTRNVLRVVAGLTSDRVAVLDQALPVLFVPIWDRGTFGRYIVPGHDGMACVFRGFGLFNDKDATFAHLAAMPRVAKDTKAKEWLGIENSRGVWRNGWLEEDTTTGTKWFADIASTVASDQIELPLDRFDLLSSSASSSATSMAARRVDCSQDDCSWPMSDGTDSSWRDLPPIRLRMDWFRTSFISNGTRFGLFSHEALDVLTTSSVYLLDQLIANLTLATLLVRWLVALLTLSKNYESIGVGALASAPSFRLLPLLLLPRLKSAFEGFWTAGCQFEGNQMVLSESWFVMYPAIGEVVLLYFSLLNGLAKLLRRRISDVLFGPTLLFFGLLHYLRFELAASTWLTRSGVDGRIATVVTASEVDAASLLTFFTSDLAWRLNGQVTSLFLAKIVVLALNLVPLVVGYRSVLKPKKHRETELRGVEQALAMRFGWNGGLGLSSVYASTGDGARGSTSLSAVLAYEMVRFGYVALACPVPKPPAPAPSSSPHRAASPSAVPEAFVVVSIDSWLWLLFLAPHPRHDSWRTLLIFRIVVLEATLESPPSQQERSTRPPVVLRLRDIHPVVGRVADTRFRYVRPWQIAACAIE